LGPFKFISPAFFHLSQSEGIMKNMDNLKEMTNAELENYLSFSTMDLNAINFRATEIEQEIAQLQNDMTSIINAIGQNTIDLDECLQELETVESNIEEIEQEIRHRQDNQIYQRSYEELESLGQAVLKF